jgi:hypothetical protein
MTLRGAPALTIIVLLGLGVQAKRRRRAADNNRQSCNISDRLLNEVDGYHRQAAQARNNVCAGRPLRSYPPDIIQR